MKLERRSRYAIILLYIVQIYAMIAKTCTDRITKPLSVNDWLLVGIYPTIGIYQTNGNNVGT